MMNNDNIHIPDENESKKQRTSTYSENSEGATSAYHSEGATSAYNEDNDLKKKSKTHHISVGDKIELKNKSYIISDIISEGTGEAVIYKIIDSSENTLALKLYYEFSNYKEEPNYETLQRIVQLNDPDILKLQDFGAGKDKYIGKYCFEISAFAEGGDLFNVPNFKEKYTPEFIEKHIIPEIYKGICTLHKNKIYHCDLKPGNVFYIDNFQQNLVIGDYGSAKAYDLDSEKDVRKSSTVKGTEAYIAPEQSRGIISDKNDFYSFGMIILHLLYPESISNEKDFSKIDRLKFRNIAERQFSEIPIIDFNPDYKKLNTLIEGLTLHNFSQRWSSKEVLKWLNNENVEVSYKAKTINNVPPVKLGTYTIKNEKDLIIYIENNDKWFEELVEDQDTYTTFKIWLDAYKDIPTRKKIDDIIKFYAPSGERFVKDVLLRMFDSERPVFLDIHVFELAKSKNLDHTIHILIAQLDELFKILTIDDVKFIFLQLELTLKLLHSVEEVEKRQKEFSALYKKIFTHFGLKLKNFDFKSEIIMLFEKAHIEKTLKHIVELFYDFNASRSYRDLRNNNLASIEEMALYYASMPEIADNPVLKAEKEVFLESINKTNLLSADAQALVFEVFKKEAVSELELLDVTFDRENNFRFIYRFYKSLNDFLKSKGINTSFVSQSVKKETFNYKKKFYQTFGYVCHIFIKTTCKNHNISSLPTKNKRQIRKKYNALKRKQYRLLYRGRNWALALFFMFSLFFTGIFTHYINIDKNFRIRIGKINRAFLNTSPTKKNDIPSDVQTTVYPLYKVSTTEVNIRSGPGKNYKSIGKARRNEAFEVLDSSGQWYKINYKNSTAYIHSDYLIKQQN